MASSLTVMGNREILLVAETIAHEKGISPNDIISAMEDGIKLAAKKKYGHNLDIECRIDKKSGQIKLYNKLRVVSDNDETEFDDRTIIKLSDAKIKDKSITIKLLSH